MPDRCPPEKAKKLPRGYTLERGTIHYKGIPVCAEAYVATSDAGGVFYRTVTFRALNGDWRTTTIRAGLVYDEPALWRTLGDAGLAFDPVWIGQYLLATDEVEA